MGSWVYIFSKFTPEALLFEALIFFILCAGYVAFWIIRKRRLGVAGPEIPAGLVKLYLSQLIVDAEQMRSQLFGLLGGADISALKAQGLANFSTLPGAELSLGIPAGGGMSEMTSAQMDPILITQIGQLEAKMQAQTQAMQAMVAEKDSIQAELASARTAAPGGASGAGSAEDADKIRLLEAKLAEYSIIEDDLANLKRLQQENAQLKAALAGQGGALPVATAAATTTATVAAAATSAAVAENTEAADIFASLGLDAAEAAAPVPAEDPTADFAGLVDQVEKSLQDPPAEAPPEVAAPAPAAPAAAPEPVAAAAAAPAAAASSSPNEKSDADLVAEFEKMLNA